MSRSLNCCTDVVFESRRTDVTVMSACAKSSVRLRSWCVQSDSVYMAVADSCISQWLCYKCTYIGDVVTYTFSARLFNVMLITVLNAVISHKTCVCDPLKYWLSTVHCRLADRDNSDAPIYGKYRFDIDISNRIVSAASTSIFFDISSRPSFVLEGLFCIFRQSCR